MAIKRKITTDTPSTEPINKEPEIKGSKQVKVEVDKKIDDTVQVDFMSDSFSQDHASKKTKENIGNTQSSIPLDKDINEVRDDIKNAENKRGAEQFTLKDIHQIATFIINAIDGGFAILLNFIARDNRVSVYTLPAETKRQLTDQLALILVKYQVKFKIEFLFLMTIIIAYIGPVGGAIKNRKNPNREIRPGRQPKEKAPEQKQPEQKQEEQFFETKEEPKSNNGTIVAELKIDENVEPYIKRPRRESRKRVTTNG